MKITLEQIITAGIHLGHPTRRWHPKRATYTYGVQNGIYLIDLVKTRQQLKKAQDFISKVRREGNEILFVGTKSRAAQTIEVRAKFSQSFFVNKRWLGGILTNWVTIQISLLQLHRLERERRVAQNWCSSPSKKKKSTVLQERLNRYLGGLKGIRELPGVLVIVGQLTEMIAIQEARNLKIPIICTLDTDCNPDLVDIGVPINDDSMERIRLFLETLLPGIQKGRLFWISTKAHNRREISLFIEKQFSRILIKLKSSSHLEQSLFIH
jgi:small subunit ribosomal protein S2